MDIAYIPMAHGFVYLEAVLDRASRRVLSWRVSVTLDSTFCIAAVVKAVARYRMLDILYTDRGAQFTSAVFTGLLQNNGIQTSTDAKGYCSNNIFVHQLLPSLKNEEVYLHAFPSVSAATAGIARYFTLYDSRRPHSILTDRPPDDAYSCPLPLRGA